MDLYKQKYTEALARAKKEWIENLDNCYTNYRERLKIIFPELGESENTRIRKAIYNALKYLETELSWDFVDEVDILDVYAWLEKQGEYQQLYIRFGDIPANEKSKIYSGEQEIGSENGVSVYPAFKSTNGDIVLGLNLPITKTTLHTQQYLLEYDNRPCYLVTGDYIGKDTDGQILISNVNIIEKINNYRVKTEKQDDTASNRKYEVKASDSLSVGTGLPFDYEKATITQTDDKVEPKFKVGDWCIDNEDDTIFQIVKVLDHTYTYRTNEGKEYSCPYYSLENDARLWTIQDAKDGDVLVCDINKAEIGGDIEKLPNITPTICIYQNVDKDHDYIHSYCSLYDGRYLIPYNTMYYKTFVYNIQPATKEQCDLLFQKMREAGFEWNSKNKELKKVEYKFNIDDWIVTDDSFGKIVRHVDEISNNIIDKGYIVSDENGLIYNPISFDKEHKWHKWTIKDAEDGDILVYKNDDVEWILIYKNIIPESCDVPHDVLKYYALFTGNVFYDSGIVGMISENYASCFTPATKEQYDFFFQKMKEAEYEWDPEKKELSKQTSEKFYVGQFI